MDADIELTREQQDARIARQDKAAPRWSGDRATTPLGTHRTPQPNNGVTRTAPDAPKVGRTRVSGQWESVTVFRHETSPHFALMSPEAMREMARGRERKYGHRGGDKRAEARAIATARAALRAEAIAQQLTPAETMAKMTAGSAAYRATGTE